MSLPGFSAPAALARNGRIYALPRTLAHAVHGRLSGGISTEPPDPTETGPSCGHCRCDPGQTCADHWYGCSCTSSPASSTPNSKIVV